ncbi:MAG: hypothetical protein C0623_06710 [Desulfuromonas sp.]|nr:MAG: hypothetical protein C0623_06710 [Desulfuromonas sp.]
MFRPFERKSHPGVETGSGVGLATAKIIYEGHGGKTGSKAGLHKHFHLINTETTPDQGSQQQ